MKEAERIALNICKCVSECVAPEFGCEKFETAYRGVMAGRKSAFEEVDRVVDAARAVDALALRCGEPDSQMLGDAERNMREAIASYDEAKAKEG